MKTYRPMANGSTQRRVTEVTGWRGMISLHLNREEAMPVVIGAAKNGFANPIGLLSDCHRRIERFLKTLEAVADQGGVLDAQCRNALQTRFVDEAKV